MKYVYLLEHTHVYSENEEDTKTVGIYGSEEEAKRAMEKLKEVPGFNRHPQGFNIDRYKIGETFWLEGYSGE